MKYRKPFRVLYLLSLCIIIGFSNAAAALPKIIHHIDTCAKLKAALSDQETDIAALEEKCSIIIDQDITIGKLKDGSWKKIEYRSYSDLTIEAGATITIPKGAKLSIGDPYANERDTDETLIIDGTLTVDGGWLSIGSPENRFVVINNGVVKVRSGSVVSFCKPFDVDDPYEPKMEWGKTSEGSVIFEEGAIVAAKEDFFIDRGVVIGKLYYEEMVEVRAPDEAPSPSYLTAGEYRYDSNANAFVKR